ncbi:MAG: Tfp pilus assembly protein FimT/FimU [Acidobacteriota bacterium]
MVGLAVFGLAIIVSLPALAGLIRRERLMGATRELARTMMAARWRALGEGRATGLKFTLGGELSWTLYRDGDGDGLRSADISTGTEVALSRPVSLSHIAHGVRAGILPRSSIPRLPPQQGLLSGTDDPVKFGRSDLLSFAPAGSATPGSLYLTDGMDMTAIVVNGVTGRLRLFRYKAPENLWKEMS